MNDTLDKALVELVRKLTVSGRLHWRRGHPDEAIAKHDEFEARYWLGEKRPFVRINPTGTSEWIVREVLNKDTLEPLILNAVLCSDGKMTADYDGQTRRGIALLEALDNDPTQ